MKIIFDASNLGATGPTVLFKTLLPALVGVASDAQIELLLPSSMAGESFESAQNLQVHYVRRGAVREVSRLYDIHIGLRGIAKKLAGDIYFTYGDIGPDFLPMSQIINLHQAYMVYMGSELDRALPMTEKIKLRYQRRHFAVASRRAAAVVVQTPVMAARVESIYRLPASKVTVIAPPLPAHIEALQGKRQGNAVVKDGPLTLLFLATYYAHKNHAILPGVARELRRRGMSGSVRFLLTLDGDRRKAETRILARLAEEGDMVENLGRLTPEDAAQALMGSGALFLPTLVETYGLIYLEAMAAGIPVLTSDRDFARYVCGDLASYFDPHDPVSIVDAIEGLLGDQGMARARMAQEAPAQISRVSSNAQDNARQLVNLFRHVVAAS